MGRGNAEGSRKVKSMRDENVHENIFTPRTYQVELLDAALLRNTIVCLGTETGKTFIAVMLIKELAHMVRPPINKDGKRTVFLVNTVSLVEHQAKVIRMHTDLSVGEYVDTMGITCWDIHQWQREVQKNQVFVMTAQIFADVLHRGFMGLHQVNLVVCDECHHAVEDRHPYAQIMKCYYGNSLDSTPRILGLTTSVVNDKCRTPQQLSESLNNLEQTLHSTAETATDMLAADLHSIKPKEYILQFTPYRDQTGIVAEMDVILDSAITFLKDSVIPFKEEAGEQDPRLIPRTVLTECQSILHSLGPWCAAKVAHTLARQVAKIEDQETLQWHKYLLQLTYTYLKMIQTDIERRFNKEVQCLEDFWLYMSPKVCRLIEVLREYKPDDSFVIIGDGDIVDGSEVSDDSLDLSDDSEFDDETDAECSNNKGANKSKQNKKSQVHYIAVKPKHSSTENESEPEPREDDGMCGIVFVERRHTAFALNKLIQELCIWDADLYFLQCSHITGQWVGKQGPRSKDTEAQSRKQEEMLRKFRQKEVNLLISTSVLEEGVDIPNCNMVVRFDLPGDYRSFVQSKGRARAKHAKYYMLMEEGGKDRFAEDLEIFRGIEKILRNKFYDDDDFDEQNFNKNHADSLLPPYIPVKQEGSPQVTMTTAITLVNRYCAKLPSDAFTHLTPKCKVEELPGSDQPMYVCTLQLPINSPIKKPIIGEPMANKRLAKMAVALKTCSILHQEGELDDNLLPIGKEVIRYEEDEGEWAETEAQGQARPGTTKRKQYYYKKIAEALKGHPTSGQPHYLYIVNMTLTCPITEEQNTRGRKIHAPEDTPRDFGIINVNRIPNVPLFPVFTRSGEVTVSVDLITSQITFTKEEIQRLGNFHQFVFSRVLRLEKDPMVYAPKKAECSYIVVPLTRDNGNIVIDWPFIETIEKVALKKPQAAKQSTSPEKFVFRQEDFEDAVVMPSYRNLDQPQYFYVAEIRYDLNPKSPFPSPELYQTFLHYYENKYGLKLTSQDQPLLDVDHTSARLNLLTPRYMNQKGVALPTSSAETRRARRENLQQKQILIPELCDVHPFPASLWRKTVCLPAILYRVNSLLIAEEIRILIAHQAHIGLVNLPEEYRFPKLDFGFSTDPKETKEEENKEEIHEGDSKEKLEDQIDDQVTSGEGESSCDQTIVLSKTDFEDGETDEQDQCLAKVETDCNADDDLQVLKQQSNAQVFIVEELPGDQKTDQKNETNNGLRRTRIPVDEETDIVAQNIKDTDTQLSIGDQRSMHGVSDNEIKNQVKGVSACMNKITVSDDSCPAQVEQLSLNSELSKLKPSGRLAKGLGDFFQGKFDTTEGKFIHLAVDEGDVKHQRTGSTSSEDNTSESSFYYDAESSPSPFRFTHDSKTDSAFFSSGSEQGHIGSSKDTLCSDVETLEDGACGLHVRDGTPSNPVSNSTSEASIHERAKTGDCDIEVCTVADTYSKNDANAINKNIKTTITTTTTTITETTVTSTNNCEMGASQSTVTTYLSNTENSSDRLEIDEGPAPGLRTDTCVVPDQSQGSRRCTMDDGEHQQQSFETDSKSTATSTTEVTESEDCKPITQFDFDVDLENFIGPSPCVILQTLTMSNANDFFNLERLETIGDSFLKYAITVYLYCTYPGIHEGKLSYLRSKQVSNYNLYRLGKGKGFPDCMVSAKFEPTENWLPPGYAIKKEGAFKGLNVYIASTAKMTLKGVSSCETTDDSANECSGDDSRDKTEDSKIGSKKRSAEQLRFNKELEEVTRGEDSENKEESIDPHQCLIPYNLQTQHSLPDKSIADCVEALIGCYLTTCGHQAALLFMSWLGLKVLPLATEENSDYDTKETEDSSGILYFGRLQPPPSPLLPHVPQANHILSHYLDGYEAFEERIQYHFRDRSYLLQAFTHASYHYNTVTDCYQRLEFLGDAILDYVITRHLFEDAKKHSPGILTDLRSALVNNNIFAALAVKWDFHKYFKAVSPQLFTVIEKFVASQKEKDDNINLDEEFLDCEEEEMGEGEDIEIPKALGDIFESVAGAIYLDSAMSLDTVWRVYYRMMKPQIDQFTAKIPKSPVRDLLELEPETAKFEKPERTMDGKIRVTVNVVGKGKFCGVGRNYRIAKSAAAKRALKYIKMLEIQVQQQIQQQAYMMHKMTSC